MNSYFKLYTFLGYEGIMLRPSGVYEFGEHLSNRTNSLTQWRSRTLWKHKLWEDDEFICVGVTQGQGKADIGIGALQFQPRPETFRRWETPCEVGTGFSDEERIHFMQHPPIGDLIKVRYLTLTNDLKPFNPSYLCHYPKTIPTIL
jgi:ATP-dependent DNA ligase